MVLVICLLDKLQQLDEREKMRNFFFLFARYRNPEGLTEQFKALIIVLNTSEN